MIIGLVSSPNRGEKRVALVPAQVKTLAAHGAEIVALSGVGEVAGYTDQAYSQAGARVVYDRMEALARPDVVLCPDRPSRADLAMVKAGASVMGLLNRHAGSRSWFQTAKDEGVTVIALEEMRDQKGMAVLERRFAQIAGSLCPTIAGGLLQSGSGRGHGILLGAIPGFPSAEVVIIGAGVLGRAAARGFAGLGAQVTLLDTDIAALETAEALLPGRVITRLSGPSSVRHALGYANVVLTCAAVHDAASPRLLSLEDLKALSHGSLLMDLAIDQGGNAETSRPIFTPEDAYIEEGIIHFAMPNLSSLVARTASKVFSATITPWLLGLLRGDTGTLRALEHAKVQGDEWPTEEAR